MSDAILRTRLIRLASEHPEFRKDLLPLIKSAEQEAPMVGKFEKGKPADPTSQMSPEDAKKWQEMNDEHGDKFKTAGLVTEEGVERKFRALRLYGGKLMANDAASYYRLLDTTADEVTALLNSVQ